MNKIRWDTIQFFGIAIITFSVLGIIAYLLYLTLPPFMSYFERLARIASGKIVKNIKHYLSLWKYIIYTIYTISSVALFFFVFKLINGEQWSLIAFLTYPLLVIFLGTLVDELNKNLKKKVFIPKVRIPGFMKENYIVDRLKLLCGRILLHIVIYLLIFYILWTIFEVTLDNDTISYQSIYFMFVLLPIALTIFVYIGVKDESEMNLRRIITYLGLLIFAFIDSYSQFKELFGEEGLGSLFNYFVYITLGIFAALENCVKAIYNDYRFYHKEK
ncbi:hypothetical protein [Oceanobacillus jeddahense]|uniref:Uncharacterized protein n=1 Tax=Oceanobacillus jeddahense TaxID=1462527 RepID=A0ABY5JWC5_9BACI|nr:hypothetical protein [Oceanobacillus jeddahense]UUI03473.1 hypothetical protein NP439_01900 [Oceanobacillus jeddahense]